MIRFWTVFQRLNIPLWLLLAGMPIAACSSTQSDDPAKVLADPKQSTARHRAAVSMLEDQASDDVTVRLLKRAIVVDGYAESSRELAYERLRSLDPEGLRRLLEIRLPRAKRLLWRRWICELIAQDLWLEMTPTLIRAWAQPVPELAEYPEKRPERIALVEMYGEDKLPDVLMSVMLDAHPITAANLRSRCWELLIEEGERGQLVAILSGAEVDTSDGMLTDLREIAKKTGVIPRNREEIFWARALCTHDHAEYLGEVTAAVAAMPESRRNAIEMRDLAIIRAAFQHDPSLLEMSDQALYERLESSVKSRDRNIPTASFEGWSGDYSESLYKVRSKLKWGDLAAMLLAVKALQVEQVRDHIFDYAERDLEDKSTEFGGLFTLDSEGRFVVLEFMPRLKQGDNRFVATQVMFDAGYTALFHFHNHAQSYDNSRYAGPHLGDFTYARNTRANCLVFTFLTSRTIDVDFYRYDRVVVDLGVLPRPQ